MTQEVKKTEVRTVAAEIALQYNGTLLSRSRFGKTTQFEITFPEKNLMIILKNRNGGAL